MTSYGLLKAGTQSSGYISRMISLISQ